TKGTDDTEEILLDHETNMVYYRCVLSLSCIGLCNVLDLQERLADLGQLLYASNLYLSAFRNILHQTSLLMMSTVAVMTRRAANISTLARATFAGSASRVVAFTRNDPSPCTLRSALTYPETMRAF